VPVRERNAQGRKGVREGAKQSPREAGQCGRGTPERRQGAGAQPGAARRAAADCPGPPRVTARGRLADTRHAHAGVSTTERALCKGHPGGCAETAPRAGVARAGVICTPSDQGAPSTPDAPAAPLQQTRFGDARCRWERPGAPSEAGGPLTALKGRSRGRAKPYALARRPWRPRAPSAVPPSGPTHARVNTAGKRTLPACYRPLDGVEKETASPVHVTCRAHARSARMNAALTHCVPSHLCTSASAFARGEFPVWLFILFRTYTPPPAQACSPASVTLCGTARCLRQAAQTAGPRPPPADTHTPTLVHSLQSTAEQPRGCVAHARLSTPAVRASLSHGQHHTILTLPLCSSPPPC
jgi:hypothetical protein